MPLGAMAQVRPCFFSVAQFSESTSSTERQPSAFATSQVFATVHFSAKTLKHQKTTDCLMLPFRTAALSSAVAEVRRGDRAEAAAPARSCLRLKECMRVPREWGVRYGQSSRSDRDEQRRAKSQPLARSS